jgi:hypothetical protein
MPCICYLCDKLFITLEEYEAHLRIAHKLPEGYIHMLTRAMELFHSLPIHAPTYLMSLNGDIYYGFMTWKNRVGKPIKKDYKMVYVTKEELEKEMGEVEYILTPVKRDKKKRK